MKNNTLLISDTHLGSKVLNCKKLLWVLENIKFKRLIINGDLFDDLKLHRLNKEHWKVLSTIRKISKKKPVIFCEGNHDSNIHTIISLIGASYHKDYVFFLNNRKFLITHGDTFDTFTINHPNLTWFFTGIYYIIQKLSGKNQTIPRFCKYISKKWLKVHIRMRNKAIEFANQQKSDVIILGHSHLADEHKDVNVQYYNLGTFCEDKCHFITIDNLGNCKLEEI